MVTLELTEEKVVLLKPIVTEEPKKPVLSVATAAPQWNAEGTVWRLQAEHLNWKRATKIFKIINTNK